MQDFVSEHRALTVKHARAFLREQGEQGESIALDDVAHEIELMLAQLGAEKGLTADQVKSPDAYLRAIARHGVGRAKRRRALISQVAAGDDLAALSRDLLALDADLPPLPEPPSEDALRAYTEFEGLLAKLGPPDDLATALLFLDGIGHEDAGRAMGETLEAFSRRLRRILDQAKACGLTEGRLQELGRGAVSPSATTAHVDDPVLALIRGGDTADDIHEDIVHVARCADCRALLTEGPFERRSVVVLAIEAPRTSSVDLERVADRKQARLAPRGSGRWAAIVDAEHADSFREELERAEGPVVSRVASATPIEVRVDDTLTLRVSRPSLKSAPSAPDELGTDAAEVSAWAKVACEPRRKPPGPSPIWATFAVLAVTGAMLLAYVLATKGP